MEAALSFFSEHPSFDFEYEDLSTAWLMGLAQHYDVSIAQVNYIFCTDEAILEINRQYLDHDYYTDIITFPYSEGNDISSDIFISIDTVQSNAHKFETSFETELTRVIAHGFLHLIGFKDKTEEDTLEMRKQEDFCIAEFARYSSKASNNSSSSS